jgi:Ca2+/Na+ antiporter
MKIDNRLLAIWILATILFVAFVLGSVGCSATYHLNKYQQKGGICGKIDTIKVTKYDTINHRYYSHDSIIVVNDRVVPLTRQEIRYQYKIHRDTIRLKETIVKEVTKQEKEETKQTRSQNRSPWVWVLMGLIGLVALYLIKRG